MRYEIIEDASPYYVRFRHAGITDIVNFCLDRLPDLDDPKIYLQNPAHPGFRHHVLGPKGADKVLDLIPLSKIFSFQRDRVSLFITQPGYYYRAHKDGFNTRISINYPILIQDQKCLTRWYSDEDLQEYPIDDFEKKTSRECMGFDQTKHRPVKTMTARSGEVILFNTNIFHDFDNSESPNHRAILTLRLEPPARKDLYFEQAKSMIFD